MAAATPRAAFALSFASSLYPSDENRLHTSQSYLSIRRRTSECQFGDVPAAPPGEATQAQIADQTCSRTFLSPESSRDVFGDEYDSHEREPSWSGSLFGPILEDMQNDGSVVDGSGVRHDSQLTRVANSSGENDPQIEMSLNFPFFFPPLIDL
ncbi:uncharacterized protein FIBRA_08889 [Fibroporia radiculosa]|uniref:Uncharacterized protein n=1 Tax=Fibroporia radiculosa TaxID=599839 RepID=J4GXK6_9APHY|nr:uncharacterized protein FIBRA_08889 [Fibroporia radiculosa]CCM06610.1 predicted protein [Fibroporia radiculosa]